MALTCGRSGVPSHLGSELAGGLGLGLRDAPARHQLHRLAEIEFYPPAGVVGMAPASVALASLSSPRERHAGEALRADEPDDPAPGEVEGCDRCGRGQRYYERGKRDRGDGSRGRADREGGRAY